MIEQKPEAALQETLEQRLARLSPAKRALLEQRLRPHAIPVAPPERISSSPGPFPLSLAQRRLWILQQLDPTDCSYHAPKALRLRGPLDLPALEQAVNTVIARHDALRVHLGIASGEPVQVVAPGLRLALPLIDLSSCPRGTCEEELARRMTEESRGPFDLTRGPLLRAGLYRLAADEHVLLVVLHHLISDGWSMQVLFGELAACYDAAREGAPLSLPPLPLQYPALAAQQQPAPDLDYWRERLRDLPASLELPLDHPRPSAISSRGASCQRLLSPELLASLTRLGRHHGATLFMVVLTAFEMLLSRYSDEGDIAVGSPVAGRVRQELEGLIGFFINTLVLRTDLSGDPTFAQALDRVRETVLEAHARQQAPLELVLESLARERAPGAFPLPVLFQLRNVPVRFTGMAGLETEWVSVETGTTKAELSVECEETPQGLLVTAEYSTDLFEAATVARLLGHFECLLRGAVSDPHQLISRLPLLTESERRQVLVDWNDTAREYPREARLHHLFEAQAAAAPEQVAVIDGERRITYAELDHRANGLAHRLRASGLTAGGRVGLCLERSLEWVVAVLAVLKAGGAYVPLDPDYPADRLAFMLEDSGVRAVIASPSLRTRLPAGMETLLLGEDEARAFDGPEGGCSLAYVMYTSGSTGRPKGVAVPHRAITRLVCNTDYVSFARDDVVAQASNASFDAVTFEVWGALLHGATLVILDRDTVLSPPALTESLRRHGITMMFLTTSLFNAVARERPAAFASLRYLVFGGEAADPRAVRAVLAAGPPAHLVNGYGPTETTTFATSFTVEELAEDATSLPIGRPIANTRVYLLDRHLQPIPVGVRGEVFIGGDGVACGYLGDAELTARRFLPDAFSGHPGARLYRTGDLARYRPDGLLEFLGRVDDQVKIRGFRIEPAETEAELAACPGVAEALVVVTEPSPGEKRLVAYAVPRAGATLDPLARREHLRQRLPAHLVPSAVLALASFPLTPNGKVDRAALPMPNWSELATDEHLPPRTALEERLARIWEEVLGVAPIGVRESFFDLGGHSLLALQVFARIEAELGRRLPPSVLLQSPTIEALARAMQREDWVSLVPLRAEGRQRPFFCVHAAGGGVLGYRALAERLGDDQPFYGLQERRDAGHEEVSFDIVEMARGYLAEVRSLQPNGPYLLGGHSFGGVVAFEMAQQLVAQGEGVALLAIFDTQAPAAGARTRGQRVRDFVSRLRRLRTGDRAALLWRAATSRLPRRSAPAPETPWPEVDETRYLEALARYRPAPYPGPVTVFRATSAADDRFRDPALGWRALAHGGVAIHEVPGQHRDLLDPPHVSVTAQKLKECLHAAHCS